MGNRSRCGKAKVGAVVVTPDQQVVSTGYNGPPSGIKVYGSCWRWCPRAQAGHVSADYSSCLANHAEANAMLFADRSKILGGTIYVSSAMCVNCAKMVANSGISRVVHAVRPQDAHRNPRAVEEMLARCGLSADRAWYDRIGFPPRMMTFEGMNERKDDA